jgi:hypothetical protein
MLADEHKIVAGVLVSKILSQSLQNGEAERIAQKVAENQNG